MSDTQSTTLTLLYTANLGGNLAHLPRLYTVIRRLKRVASPAVLVDLGGACGRGVWHCEATGGRSMYIALDGMGYTAVNASELARPEREQLYQQSALALVTDTQTHVIDQWLFALSPTVGDGHLCVILKPAPYTRLDDRTLTLAALSSGQVGMAQIAASDNRYTLLNTKVSEVPPDTPSDATIAGLVDFIEAEARHRQRRNTPPDDS